MIFGEILGPDLVIVIAIIALLFGGGQIPKLAKSLGQAKREFEKGLSESDEAPAPVPPKAITTDARTTDANVVANDGTAEPKP